jgi:hypothetical protein
VTKNPICYQVYKAINDNSETTSDERRKASFEAYVNLKKSLKKPLPPDFDYKKELADYREEHQINPKGSIVIDNSILSSDKGKTLSKFKEKFLKIVDQPCFQLILRKDI